MADEIVFYDQFYGETPIPSKLKYDNITLTMYMPFGPEWTVNTHYSYEDPVLLDSMSVSQGVELPSYGNIRLDDIWDVGFLEFSDLLTLMPHVNDQVTVIDLYYGINKETDEIAHFCIDLLCTDINYPQGSTTPNYAMYNVYSYIKYTHPDSLDRTVVVKNTNMGIGPGVAKDYMKFSIIFMYPLDRLATIDQAIMLCSISADLSTDNTGTYMTITPNTEGSTLYNLRNQYVIDALVGYSAYLLGVFDLANLALLSMEVYEQTQESPEAGPASEEGGYTPGTGGFDDTSDTIGVPSLPTLGASNLGFVNVYKVTSGSLQLLINEIFPPLVYTPPTTIAATDVTDAIVAMANQFIDVLGNIPQFFNQINAEKYMSYVLDCHIVPVDPGSGAANTPIHVGNKTLLSTGEKLSSDYVEVDCGTLSLAEYYANFADFLTTFKLFLPFVGFVPAEPEWFYRESIQVVYHFNIVDGSFIAYVLSTGAYVNNNNYGRTILGQYSGSCCVHIPLTGQAYANMFQNVLGSGISSIKGITSSLTGTVTSAMTGNVGGAINSAVNGVDTLANSMLATVGAKPDVMTSNPYTASAAFLSCRRPFTMIERPVSCFPTTYAKENGIPSNVSKQLGKVTGFNIIGNIHLDGVDATEAEKAEIEELLGSGVIL